MWSRRKCLDVRTGGTGFGLVGKQTGKQDVVIEQSRVQRRSVGKLKLWDCFCVRAGPIARCLIATPARRLWVCLGRSPTALPIG